MDRPEASVVKPKEHPWITLYDSNVLCDPCETDMVHVYAMRKIPEMGALKLKEANL
jgi:hypothetical protein